MSASMSYSSSTTVEGSAALPASHPFAMRSFSNGSESSIAARRSTGPPPPPRRSARRDIVSKDSDSDRSRDSFHVHHAAVASGSSMHSHASSPRIPVRVASRPVSNLPLSPEQLEKPLPPILPLGQPISSRSTQTSALPENPTRKNSVPFALLHSKLGVSEKLNAETEAAQPDPYVGDAPSRMQLMEAATSFVRDENGDLVCFGDLFPQTSEGRTVVFFIRHFWCGQCQDYMFASLSQLDPEALKKANVRVAIVSNGSWKIIKAYRKLFDCPFPVYVDGQRRLYSLMGMTKMTNDFGPSKNRAAYHQRAVPGQLVHGVGNALLKMPIANPGKLTQLGGEFVLGNNYTCHFAHRMTNTSNHMEAPDVLREAGVAHPTRQEHHELRLEASQLEEMERLQKQEDEWRDAREAELERIQRRKAARRGDRQELEIRVQAEEMDQLDIALSRVELSKEGHAGTSGDETAWSRSSSAADLAEELSTSQIRQRT